jgi:ABC-type glycerol-3-phosphate transport system substrate-binding protein
MVKTFLTSSPMFNSKKTFFTITLVSILLFSTSCSLLRKKELPPPVDNTEKSLVIYNMYDAEDVFEPMIQEYFKENPYVRIEYYRFDDFEEYEKRILNELAEGEGPDIFAMPNSWFIKNRKKLSAMPASEGNPTAFRTIFVEAAANDLITPDNDGVEQVYGLPLYVDTLGIYYNKDHFEDSIPTRGKPSSTWDGIKNDVYLLTKESNSSNSFEVSGIALGVTENVSNALDVLFAMMIQYGDVFYDETMSKATFSSYTSGGSRPSTDAVTLFTSFADSSQKYYSWNEDQAANYDKGDISAFVAGEVSMIFGYASTYAEILSERGNLRTDKVDVIDIDAIASAPMPQIEDPTVSTEKRDTYAEYFAFGVSRNTEYPDTAWKFLTFLSTPNNATTYFDATHRPTSLRSLIPDQSNDPLYGTFAKQVGYAETFPVVDYLLFREMMDAAISSINSGTPIGSALNAVEDRVSDSLPKGGVIVPIDPDYVAPVESVEE